MAQLHRQCAKKNIARKAQRFQRRAIASNGKASFPGKRSCQVIAGDIQCHQVTTRAKLYRQRSRQLVFIQSKACEIDKMAKFRRNGTCQDIFLELQDFQVRQAPQLCWNPTCEVVIVEEHVPPNVGPLSKLRRDLTRQGVVVEFHPTPNAVAFFDHSRQGCIARISIERHQTQLGRDGST